MASNTYRTLLISIYSFLCLTLLFLTVYSPIFIIFFIGIFLLGWIFVLFLTGKFTAYHYTLILIPSIILSPIVSVPGFPMDLRLDDLWMAFGAVLLVISMIKKKDLTFYFPGYAKTFLIFIAWIAVTISLSTFREPYYYSMRDWTEVYKNIKLLVYLLIVVNLIIDIEQLKKVVNVFLISMLGTAIFGMLQYFNLFSVNSWLTPHYIFESNLYGLEMNSRVVGTFGNPNIFGFALLIGVALSLSELFKSFKLRYAMMLLVFFVAITMSQSRTALVAAVALILIMSFMVMWKTKKKIRTFFLFSLIPFIGFIALQYAPQQFFTRVTRLSDISSDSSFSARLSSWEKIYLTRTQDNMLFGTGPVSGMRITFDNEWLMLLTLYGVVGVAIFLVLFGGIYYKLGRLDSDHLNFYNIAVKGLMIVLAICMFMSNIFTLLQLMPLIILLIGLVLNKSVIDKSNKNSEQTTNLFN